MAAQEEEVATEHAANEELAGMMAALEALPLAGVQDVVQGMLRLETIQDLKRWKGDVGLAEGLRSLYLRKRYGRSAEYKAALARVLELRAPLRRQDVVDVFGMQRPEPAAWRRAELNDGFRRKKELVGQALRASPPGSLAAWTFEDKLEAVGCAVHGRGLFNVWCEDTGQYDVWTAEYVDRLAAYLAGRLGEMAPPLPPASRASAVLEVGAGSGALSHHLNAALSRRGCDFRCVATDPDLRGAPRQRAGLDKVGAAEADASVRQLDVLAALEQVPCAIVLCAWMPMDTDWTHLFRHTAGVAEYVLVGEADFGVCGDNWRTWGNEAFRPEERAAEAVPHLADGWERHDLPDLARWQMQRYDSDVVAGNSTTVSFRKREGGPAREGGPTSAQAK